MDMELQMWLVALAVPVLLVGVVGVVYARCTVTCPPGHVLVVNRARSTEIFFASGLVPPVVARAEVMDIRAQRVVIERAGKDGVICRDNVRADIRMVFHVHIRRAADDILRVAQSIGCARAGDQRVLDERFGAKFSEAMKTVAKRLDFEEIVAERDAFRDEVMKIAEEDLSGWVLEGAVVERLEQTPASALDPDNILDAEGLRKITERTTQAKIRRNELQLEAERRHRQAQAEVEALIIELERNKAQALDALRGSTGRTLTERDLEARIEERLRSLIRPVVEQILDERATDCD
jgi:uncharacterized membrane protein YqiK